MKIIFLISAFISLIFSLLFFLSLAAWIGGAGSVLFPGLGLVVAMGAIVILLFITAAISIAFTILLYKSVYKKDVL